MTGCVPKWISAALTHVPLQTHCSPVDATVVSGSHFVLYFFLLQTDTGVSMKFSSIVFLSAALALTGCASVDMASQSESQKAKEFGAPSSGTAGLYVYRDSFVGKALKKDLWVNGECLGESAPDVFFRTEVAGGKTHTIETESEFSSNKLEMMFASGKNYFIRQFIKFGVFVGGADLELVPEEQGKAAIAKLSMAKGGKCDSRR